MAPLAAARLAFPSTETNHEYSHRSRRQPTTTPRSPTSRLSRLASHPTLPMLQLFSRVDPAHSQVRNSRSFRPWQTSHADESRQCLRVETPHRAPVEHTPWHSGGSGLSRVHQRPQRPNRPPAPAAASRYSDTETSRALRRPVVPDTRKVAKGDSPSDSGSRPKRR